MSTVAFECRDADCPKCRTNLFDVQERALRPGETVEELCECGVEPVYSTYYAYQAVCDRCGYHEEDYGGWAAIGPDPESMWECVDDWEHIGGRDLCPDCWFINDNDEPEELP